MGHESKAWETYEEVAVHLLDQLADHLGLDRVEGKQKVEGESGATWTVDGKGVEEGEEGFLILECKRYPSDRVEQGKVGGLAYRISDTGAEGGIVVTPIGLQEGAEKVADSENIVTVQLDEDSTTKDYVLGFLNRIFAGATEAPRARDRVDETHRGPDGEIIGEER